MVDWLVLLFRLAAATLRRRRDLVLENLALRHQLLVLYRTTRSPRLSGPDRALWFWLARRWQGWKTHLRIVRPDTVIRWHRAGFRLFWRWKSRPRRGGRRPVAGELISMIRQMCRANPLWGAPRIHGELRKLGIGVAQRTVAKYMLPGSRRPSSQTWTTFLRNHLAQMVSVDFFTVPTVNFRLLYVFLVLSHQRRKVLHFNVVECPSAAGTSQQLREAFPLCFVPKVPASRPRRRLRAGVPAPRRGLGSEGTPYRAPRALAVAVRGTVDRFAPARVPGHVLVLNPAHLRGVIENYVGYSPRSRTLVNDNYFSPAGKNNCRSTARTWDSTRTRRSPAPCSVPMPVTSWRFRRWAVCITATNGGSPDLGIPPTSSGNPEPESRSEAASDRLAVGSPD